MLSNYIVRDNLNCSLYDSRISSQQEMKLGIMSKTEIHICTVNEALYLMSESIEKVRLIGLHIPVHFQYHKASYFKMRAVSLNCALFI